MSHRGWRPLRVGAIALLLANVCASLFPAPGHAKTSPALLGKLDPALAAYLPAAGDSALTVWIEFADKGERGPADLAQRLALAQIDLTPRARARRERAGHRSQVDYTDVPVHADYIAALAAQGLAPLAVSRWFNRVAVRATPAQLAALAPFDAVRRIAPVARGQRVPRPLSPASPPFDSRATPGAGGRRNGEAFDAQRGQPDPGLNRDALQQIRAIAVHDSGYTGAGVLIAVFDEGFNAHDTHEALAGHVIAPGYARDFVDGDTTVVNLAAPGQFSHGTWVLGCLAGNLPGTYLGAAPDADLALARTENTFSETPIEMFYWGQAAEWADSLGADVISSSVAYRTFDDPFPDIDPSQIDGHSSEISQAAQMAASKGILIVNSAGNAGAGLLLVPADVNGDSLIAAGAVDAAGTVSFSSSGGPTADGRIKPDLVARGVSNPVPSTVGGPSAYITQSGTSFAAPLLAGLAACLIGARPQWSATDVIRAMRESASHPERPDNRTGYGLANGESALCWQAGGVGIPPPGTAIMLGPNPLLSGASDLRVMFTAGGVIETSSPGRIRVLDAQGRMVCGLWNGDLARGECLTVAWDGRDAGRERVAPGIYYIALSIGGEVTAARVVVLQ